MTFFADPIQWILGSLLIFSSLGVIVARKPVMSSLSFLLSLIILAAFYLQLSADFIAVMQVLVYAGAILVLFMFVIVLFQDAHDQMRHFKAKSSPWLIVIGGVALLIAFLGVATQLSPLRTTRENLPADYGTVQHLGKALYLDFFFPFEAIILLFLIAIIGAIYIAKKKD